MGLFLLIAVSGEVLFLVVSQKQSKIKKQQVENSEVSSSEDFHNDFSKVGSGDESIQVKPIDYTGDVYANNYETMRDDLNKIGINSSKN